MKKSKYILILVIIFIFLLLFYLINTNKKNNDIKAYCLDNCAALKIEDDKISVIKSKSDAKCYKASYSDKFNLEEIL